MNNLTATKYVDNLVAEGCISFTTKQLTEVMGLSGKAVERSIYYLRKNKRVVSPARGYYLIIPPEFQKLGCLPPDYFIDDLMRYWEREYYVGVLTAALYFGAAHHQPQVFQVIIDHYRPMVQCGQVRIEFLCKETLSNISIQQLKTHTGYMKISTPETTMMDLLKFLRRSGGISAVATILNELSEKINPDALLQLIIQDSELTWVQRLGYILEYLGHRDISDVIYQVISNKKTNIVPLVPYESMNGVERNKKWRVALNAVLEVDT